MKFALHWIYNKNILTVLKKETIGFWTVSHICRVIEKFLFNIYENKCVVATKLCGTWIVQSLFSQTPISKSSNHLLHVWFYSSVFTDLVGTPVQRYSNGAAGRTTVENATKFDIRVSRQSNLFFSICWHVCSLYALEIVIHHCYPFKATIVFSFSDALQFAVFHRQCFQTSEQRQSENQRCIFSLWSKWCPFVTSRLIVFREKIQATVSTSFTYIETLK